MAEREHHERLAVPVFVDDDTVLTDSEFVGLYGVSAERDRSDRAVLARIFSM